MRMAGGLWLVGERGVADGRGSAGGPDDEQRRDQPDDGEGGEDHLEVVGVAAAVLARAGSGLAIRTIRACISSP